MATLIVFTRFPRAGEVKTRLIPALGAEGAADLHRRMTQHALRQARALVEVKTEVRCTGDDGVEMRAAFNGHFECVPQGEGDLGERMHRAFEACFARGESKAVIIGSDCPAIRPRLLRRAFESLHHSDLVLGPAVDGGYYLIGMRDVARRNLFQGVAWGTSRVFGQTLERARDARVSVHLLPPLCDVDHPQDLAVWRRWNERISVVVPTLNEESRLAATLEAALRGEDVEIIVADGGSRDRTVEIAQELGAKVLCCSRGRAMQMNAGAESSEGGLLLFCHADTTLPDGFDRLVRQTLARPEVALGAFGFKSDLAGAEHLERAVRWRCDYLKLPYGDQGLFMRREMFEQLRGFAPMRVMEDFDLVRRAKKLGLVVTLQQFAVTSGRLWERHGKTRVTCSHQKRIAAYHLGFGSQ